MQKTLEQRMDIVHFIYAKDDIAYPHSCLWGDFNFCLNGNLQFDVAGQSYQSPPSYGLWIPPRTAHYSVAVDPQSSHYAAIRLDPELCLEFSASTEVLSVQPFFRHLILEAIRLQQLPHRLEEYRHLLQVVLDQLQSAPKHDYYLPQSQHPVLKEILHALSASQDFQLSLQQILNRYALSERQLLRISQTELNMSLAEWRSRAKILYAISQLRRGISIKALALELGYQHSSNFIEFFKRHTGQTPAQLKES